MPVGSGSGEPGGEVVGEEVGETMEEEEGERRRELCEPEYSELPNEEERGAYVVETMEDPVRGERGGRSTWPPWDWLRSSSRCRFLSASAFSDASRRITAVSLWPILHAI